MKRPHNLQCWLTSTSSAIALTLAASASLSPAQNTNPTNTFDTAASTASFVQWWGGGGAGATMTWDETLDAANDTASGSVRYEANFVGNEGEQFMTFFTIANRWGWDGGYILDATTYTNLSFDLRIDPSSGQRVNANDYGWLEIGLVTDGWGTIYLPGRAIPLSATTWTHFDYPLVPTLENLDKVVGFFVKMWSNGDHTNSLIFNVDNFMITKPTEVVVIPPPTVSLAKTVSGLNLLASGTGQYDRQQIRALDETFSWVSLGQPVTFEFNIKDSPGTSRPYFQAHLFLAPNTTDTAPSLDWNVPDLIWLHVENLDNGGGQATFRYKTNRPGGNDMLFNDDPAATNSTGGLIGVGSLGTVESADILGTWKLTFNNNTDATVVAPDGTTMNVSIPEDAAPLFAGTMRVCLGVQPNNLAYGGAGYVFDKVKISTPDTTLLEDDFSSGTLDPGLWVRQASDAAGVFVVPATSPWALVWTLPATGFNPLIADSVAPGATWKAPLSADFIKVQDTRRVLLDAAELNPVASYFRMLKREFVKLQVLMPGESPAPGTPTGKTGTPTPVSAVTPCIVTVRAVDSSWHLINNINHTVSITSSDESAILPQPAALLGGVGTFEVYFYTQGPQTVTATDDTDPSKAPDTGSPIQVNP
ncbi:MAG: hypothetical protein KIS67_00400 [Verrucomicrobiae bacterium]|nr:hypothetical protein [Verrucomicrobiae bacterium]